MSPALAAVQGGTLIYLEQQAHTNLYPPSGGFYPNGGILNQITDKLTYQNPKTLEIEPWIAESWSSTRRALTPWSWTPRCSTRRAAASRPMWER